MGARALRSALSARSRGSAYRKVFGVVALVILVWMGLYWWASMRELETYQLRSRVAEVVKVADTCRAAVEEFYAKNRGLPESDDDVSCAGKPPNVARPRVAQGTVTVEAAGALAQALAAKESRAGLRYVPVCKPAPCSGAPIASWDCRSGSTMDARYRQATCR